MWARYPRVCRSSLEMWVSDGVQEGAPGSRHGAGSCCERGTDPRCTCLPTRPLPTCLDGNAVTKRAPVGPHSLCPRPSLPEASRSHVPFPTGLGNTAAKLRFQTLSGELTTVQEAGGRISMDFPLNRAVAAVPTPAAAGSRLVDALVGHVPVREVLYNPDIKYLLIVLEGGQEELLSIQPKPSELLEAHPEHILVIVTALGEGDPQGVRGDPRQ